MLKKIWLFFMIAVPHFLSAVETRTISENGYASLWLWQLSNTALIDKEGIGLSKETKKEFSTPSVLWTMAQINGKRYFGTSEGARIFLLNKDTEETIYSNTNKSLITTIVPSSNGFLAVAAPNADILHFDAQNKIVTNISIGNEYVWDFVPKPKGGYDVLASLPAQIYHYDKGVLSEPIDFPDEEHLLKGLYMDDTLWVLSEKALYKKIGDRIIAVAAFNGVAANFVFHKDSFYVIQSITTPGKTPEEKEQVLSSLLSVSTEGLVQDLFSIPGFYFTSLNADKDMVYIGGDQFGLMASYDINTRNVQYSALGSGKVLMIFPQEETLQALTAEESALWTIGNKLSFQGEFISEVYDTGLISQWGVFSPNVSIVENTSIRFYVQTGTVKNTAYWDDWVEVFPYKKITAAEGRYIRYKAVLERRKPNHSPVLSPVVYGISFPYTQRNLPPKIDKISTERRNTVLSISWSASDPNKDNLYYDVYVHDIGKPRIKLTLEPTTGTNITLPNEALPSGMKKVTIVASDMPSNAPESALTAELSTLPLIFDSEAPVIGEFKVERKSDNTAIVSFTVRDNISHIKTASYLINGRNPKTIRPVDEIFDNVSESFRIIVPQSIFLQFQITDAAGNTSSKGLFIP